MAGVYIKGARLPDACWNCGWDPCMLWNEDRGDLPKHPNCPLVEVPDHGDLVDRGALEDTVLRLNFPEEYPSDDVEESWEITRSQYKLIDNVLFEMPVVIPADKEE